MKFYGQFDPPVDEFIYERYFKKDPRIGKGFFIECGAFDGLTECSCKFFEEELKWRGINVEPAPPIYDRLVANRPNSVNVSAALSDKNGYGEFKSAVHPELGELFGNGSLNHTKGHKAELEAAGCSFKEYTVPVMTFPELTKKYHVKSCDLFVLDVEGNELKVIDSMKRFGTVLPKIFVVAHGHFEQQEIIDAVEQLGYRYDTRSYVNSYFVRYTKVDRLIDWIKKKLHVRQDEPALEDEFFITARKLEKFKEGEEAELDLTYTVVEKGTFADMAAKMEGDFCVLYSLSGVEGQTSDGQTIYYQLEDDSGNKYTYRAAVQLRPDYADWRKSDLYLRSGARLIVKRGVIPCGEYQLTIYMERSDRDRVLVVPQKWKLTVRDQNIEIAAG